ncbi:hypothetical protein ACFSKI_16585 [Pseudogracilibacillus auburnensis]|uniref:Uncharacterized protein n=1 Tax=Pseudogracilibacillus auburnensis TaxID=1494959 RepID=A0A2V3WB83_9BACI|nr:hypothetical protein [Pseudogracilibacillus auburnensis]MBO1001663.1 hypothetical protein [Pseudogracilibacillus auburnensis]PXW89415.1 hypothetical protein DFR56_102192 [Pseudogracilibacillus auburnensis]
MDAALIEKVTRLVVQKLNETSLTSKEALTKEEIDRWEEISMTLWENDHVDPPSFMQALDSVEIERWNELSSKLPFSSKSVQHKTHENELVTFYKYN